MLPPRCSRLPCRNIEYRRASQTDLSGKTGLVVGGASSSQAVSSSNSQGADDLVLGERPALDHLARDGGHLVGEPGLAGALVERAAGRRSTPRR